MAYDAIVMGVSSGGLLALKQILPMLPAEFPLPVAIVQHISERSDNFFVEHLNHLSSIPVKEAEDKEPVARGTIYIAPPGYHLLIESDRCFSLSVDERVNYSCPSIDVLFESAAHAYRARLIGVVLTGTNSDGARGLYLIKARGGLTIVQNPDTAEANIMPQAALTASTPDYVVNLEDIAPLLVQLSQLRGESHATAS